MSRSVAFASGPGPSHRGTACAFLCVAILAGLIAGASSLLLRLPAGRALASGEGLRLLAAGHAPLMLFGCALPALLGGMGLLLVPDSIGAGNTAFPRLSAAAAVLVAVGTVVFAIALGAGCPGLILPALAAWTAGIVFVASDLLTTLLDHRTVRAPLSLFARAIAVAAPLAVAALPVLLGASRHLPAGVPVLDALSAALAWPALLLLAVPALGLVCTVLVGDASPRFSAAAGWILAATAGADFLVWCAPLFGHGAPHPLLLRVVLLVPGLLLLLACAGTALRQGFRSGWSGIPRWHAAGFVLVALVAASSSWRSGLPAHYLLSAGSAFALLAGLFRWLDTAASRPVPLGLARFQFVLLLLGIHLMLLPVPALVGLGAACCAASLLLLGTVLGLCASRPPRPGVARFGRLWA